MIKYIAIRICGPKKDLRFKMNEKKINSSNTVQLVGDIA